MEPAKCCCAHGHSSFVVVVVVVVVVFVVVVVVVGFSQSPADFQIGSSTEITLSG